MPSQDPADSSALCADWRARTTITVAEAAVILELSRNSAYAAVRSGDLPAITVGHRRLVPVAALRRMLGEVVDQAAS